MTDAALNTDNILCDFPTFLRKNIEELCLRSQIGLSKITLHDISVLSKDNINFGNCHFILKVPYASKRLKWEVTFDLEDSDDFAPDFEFNDDQFLPNATGQMIIQHIPSLAEWNIKDPKALSQVLNQFLTLYKKKQIEKMRQENIYSRFWDEYSQLINGDCAVTENDVEINIDSTVLTFLISLKVDCQSLPEYIRNNEDDESLTWFNPGEDFAQLQISILKLNGSRTNASLQFSPRLEPVLGNSRYFHLPEAKKDTSIKEYVLQVLKIIKGRIKMVANHYKLKKVYVTSLSAACGHLVEYDTYNFNTASFISSFDNYDCLVTVSISLKFPFDKPSVQLSSIYCQEIRVCNRKLDDYPYNVNSSPEENIERLLEWLPKALKQFKSHKH